jgi:hypothetical protein
MYSGVAVPEGQDCPVLTEQQEQVIPDSETAEAAAVQIDALTESQR